MPKQTGAKRGAGETRALVLKYAKLGLNPTDIAKVTGISRQAVYGHFEKLRADGELKTA